MNTQKPGLPGCVQGGCGWDVDIRARDEAGEVRKEMLTIHSLCSQGAVITSNSLRTTQRIMCTELGTYHSSFQLNGGHRDFLIHKNIPCKGSEI